MTFEERIQRDIGLTFEERTRYLDFPPPPLPEHFEGRLGQLEGRLGILLEDFALVLFSQMASLFLAVGALMVFSLFLQVSERATFSVVPFIDRRALWSIAGIVGAGGNAGAVSFGFLFRMESLETQGALMIVGLVVIAASALVFLVRFSPARESEEWQAIQSALASRRMVGAAAEAAAE